GPLTANATRRQAGKAEVDRPGCDGSLIGERRTSWLYPSTCYGGQAGCPTRAKLRTASLPAQALSRDAPATKQPDGQINSDFPKSCQPRESKIFLFQRRANQWLNFARLTRMRGARDRLE